MPSIDERHLSSRLFAPLRGAGLTRSNLHDHPLIWPAYGGSLAQHKSVDIPTAKVGSATQIPSQRILLQRIFMVCVAVAMASAFLVLAGGSFAGGSGRLWTALFTGLTAGGLSCLAVQGGLLAAATRTDEKFDGQDQAPRIVAFLAAKLVSYTILGALLGAFGAAIQPSPSTRGVVQALIGLFMFGTGVQMIHPNRWTRRLVLEPPPSVRRWLRSRARRGAQFVDAGVLGGLTVLIPCGVTQAMMAGAMALGTPIGGAMLMAAFTLGTFPMFFGLAYGASSLGKHARKYFNRTVSVVLLIMGFVAIQTGFNLAGHPLPIRPIMAGSGISQQTATTTQTGAAQKVTIIVANDGFAPVKVDAIAGQALDLVFTTKNVTGCTRTVVIPELKEERVLPVTGTLTMKIPSKPSGTTLRWVCGMGMYSGQIHFK